MLSPTSVVESVEPLSEIDTEGVPRIKSNSSCTLLDALTDNETESCNNGEKSVTSCVHGKPVPRFKTLPSRFVPNGEM